MAGPARRGPRARDLRPRPGGDLLRGRHPGGARPRGVPGSVSGPLDAGQRLVGDLRPRGQPLLGAAGRSTVRRLHHAQRRRCPAGRDRVVAGDPNHERAAFFAFAYPAPDGFAGATLSPAAARWDGQLGEYVLEWEDIRESPDPHALALEFARSAFRHACEVCEWDPALAGPQRVFRLRSGDGRDGERLGNRRTTPHSGTQTAAARRNRRSCSPAPGRRACTHSRRSGPRLPSTPASSPSTCRGSAHPNAETISCLRGRWASSWPSSSPRPIWAGPTSSRPTSEPRPPCSRRPHIRSGSRA